MAEQLTFELPLRAAQGREDFFVAPANALAVAQVEGWHNWPQRKLVLVGPSGAGKTHITHVWAALSGATIIEAAALTAADIPALAAQPAIAVENADRIAGDRSAEEALFHLHNLTLAEGGTLFLTAQSAPRQWPLSLPDLKSRMEATATATLDPPDDALLSAVLVKLFADRQISVAPQTIPYLVGRMERSFAAAQEMVTLLDTRALSTGRKISARLAAEVLDTLPDDPQ
ncbi:DnaA ATPase domain-containing protein [Actibacterium lipolyticum]|uniref:DnaA regulatory inactivator Hda n=1 Tax=Actibacterium lipolyticum TaxID=1524263 RepID=A0A238JS98_9RHOB|nr:DnaA/Hda family protein [Actibacterium lipolyticum]SMX32722.1 DnaA regulatory inactivator Hda [Actibacterium lipolyticum]